MVLIFNHFDSVSTDLRSAITVFCWIVFVNNVTNGRYSDNKLQDAETTDISKYPYVGSMQRVSLVDKARHRCMTVLISPLWAYTAAHCVVMSTNECLPKEIRNFSQYPHFIIMGTTDLTNWGPKGQKLDVLKGVIHPKYTYTAPSPFSARYDIGAVTVKKPFVLNSFVATAPLFPGGTAYWNTIRRMQKDPAEGDCRIVGWGSTIVLDPLVTPRPVLPDYIRTSQKLRSGRFNLITHAECCELTLRPKLCREQIESAGCECCVSVPKTTSTSGGDSGAPVVCKWHVTGNDIVVGIQHGGQVVKLIPEGDMVVRPTFYISTGVMMDYVTYVTGTHFVPYHTGLGSASIISSSFSLLFTTSFCNK